MKYDVTLLKTRYDNGETIKYLFFWGHTNKTEVEVGKFVFSQWFPSTFVVDNVEYKTAEHWMMAHKARLFSDGSSFERIIKSQKPAEVKEIGRQIKNFDQITWENHRYTIVREGNIHKFSQNPSLKNFLLSTGDRVIVEASPVDNVWGIGLVESSPLVSNPYTWKGLNLLGFALMEVRDVLRDGSN
jgi:ribA/ribD-fused uncharacterized protein